MKKEIFRPDNAGNLLSHLILPGLHCPEKACVCIFQANEFGIEIREQ